MQQTLFWRANRIKLMKRNADKLLAYILGGVFSIIDKYFSKHKHTNGIEKIWLKVIPNVLDHVNLTVV